MTRSRSFDSVLRRLARGIVPSAGALRAGAYVSALCLAAVTWVSRAALGSMTEASLVAGRSLEGLETVLGATKALEVDGQPMFVSTGTVPESLDDVLARYDAYCRAHPSTFSSLLDEAPRAGRPLPAAAERAVRGIFGKRSATDGVVLCLARRAADPSPPRLRLERFASTLDVAEIGEPTFVYARAVADRQTHVIAVWSRGSLGLRSLFPKEGDASGSDSPQSARPAHARRVFSATTSDAPCEIRVYDTPDAPAQVISQFDSDMRARGWTPLEGTGFGPTGRGYVRREGAQALVRAETHEGRTVVAVVDLARGGGLAARR